MSLSDTRKLIVVCARMCHERKDERVVKCLNLIFFLFDNARFFFFLPLYIIVFFLNKISLLAF